MPILLSFIQAISHITCLKVGTQKAPFMIKVLCLWMNYTGTDAKWTWFSFVTCSKLCMQQISGNSHSDKSVGKKIGRRDAFTWGVSVKKAVPAVRGKLLWSICCVLRAL